MSSALILVVSSTYLDTPVPSDVAVTVAAKPNATAGVTIPVVTPITVVSVERLAA
jgi:hypothetical protein